MNEKSTALSAAIIGAVAVTVLGSWVWLALFPETANDGQTGMILWTTVPLGAILGVLWAIRKR